MSERDAPPIDVALYLNARSATTPVWLAGGQIAYLSDDSGVPQLWLTDTEGATPRRLTDLGERIGEVIAAPAGEWVVFGMDSGGNERHQLWLLDVATGQSRPLTRAPGVIHRLGAISADGRRLAFASNARDERFFDVLTLDLDEEGAAPGPLVATDELLTPLAWSPDDRALLVRRDNTNLDADLLLLDVASGETTLLTPHEGEASLHGAVFDPSGDAIFLATNQDRDFAALARLDLASRTMRPLVERSWDVEALAVAKTDGALAYAVNEGGVSRLFLRVPGNPEDIAVTGLPDGVVTGLTWSPDGDYLAFSLTAPAEPGDVWISGRDGAARRVTASPMPGLDRADLVAPEIVRYPTFDGREIPALWYRPLGAGPWPVVVDVHGGPESQRRVQYSPVTQFLLACGYAVLAPNVRGSAGYGKAYCHLDDVERRMDAVADLAAATDWLAARSDVVPGKVAVMGQSYGGFMTLAAITSYPERWAAAVDVVGIANFETFLAHTGAWRRRTRAAEYGDPERDADVLRAISPLHKADRITAPLLVIHGRNDPRVPVGEAEQIVAALRARDRDVDLLVFPDEGHGLVKRPNRIAGYGAVARFLNRVLSAEC